MHDYEKIFDQASDIAVKFCFFGGLVALTYWVVTTSSQPIDASIIFPLMLAWSLGVIVLLLFGYVPVFLISIVFGGLVTGLVALKNKFFN